MWSINSSVYFYSIENHEYLKKFLVELSNPAHSSKITDWNYGGQVFLDYINQCEAVDRFIQALRGEEVSTIIYKLHIYPVYCKYLSRRWKSIKLFYFCYASMFGCFFFFFSINQDHNGERMVVWFTATCAISAYHTKVVSSNLTHSEV